MLLSADAFPISSGVFPPNWGVTFEDLGSYLHPVLSQHSSHTALGGVGGPTWLPVKSRWSQAHTYCSHPRPACCLLSALPCVSLSGGDPQTLSGDRVCPRGDVAICRALSPRGPSRPGEPAASLCGIVVSLSSCPCHLFQCPSSPNSQMLPKNQPDLRETDS